jgi:CheY-like chemotaxis protein
MDLQMPELGGMEAVSRIREEEAHTGRHIHIIALTAHAMKEDQTRCLAGGMDDYLSKPISTEALARSLHRVAGHLQEGQTSRTPQ